jgi:hypothetical protein
MNLMHKTGSKKHITERLIILNDLLKNAGHFLIPARINQGTLVFSPLPKSFYPLGLKK